MIRLFVLVKPLQAESSSSQEQIVLGVLREAFVPLFGLLSFYIPTYPSASGTAQDGRAQPGGGGGALQHGRFVFFFFWPPLRGCNYSKGWEGVEVERVCVQKQDGNNFDARRCCAAVLFWYRSCAVRPLHTCLSLGTVFFSLPSSFFASLLVLLLSSCSEQLVVLFPRARFLHSCFATCVNT